MNEPERISITLRLTEAQWLKLANVLEFNYDESDPTGSYRVQSDDLLAVERAVLDGLEQKDIEVP